MISIYVIAALLTVLYFLYSIFIKHKHDHNENDDQHNARVEQHSRSPGLVRGGMMSPSKRKLRELSHAARRLKQTLNVNEEINDPKIVIVASQVFSFFKIS